LGGERSENTEDPKKRGIEKRNARKGNSWEKDVPERGKKGRGLRRQETGQH